MIAITKSPEPQSLKHYRLHPKSTYNGEDYNGVTFTDVKHDIRNALVAEQGYLCAYCMSRIEPGRAMKVEHWHSLKKYPQQQLSYANMLGCCCGNADAPDVRDHCDTKKHDRDIHYNPAEPDHHPRLKIRYEGNGTIVSDDVEFNRQITEVLNLNFSRLKENRRSVWRAVTTTLNIMKGTATIASVKRLHSQWIQKDESGKLKEFCGVARYYLQKKIHSLQQS